MSRVIKEIKSSVLLDGSDQVSAKIEVIIHDFDIYYLRQHNDVIQLTKQQFDELVEIINEH